MQALADITAKTEKRLELYMKGAVRFKEEFPEWKDLVNQSAVGEQICNYTQESQRLSYLVADAKVWRLKLREFRHAVANDIRVLSPGVRGNAVKQLERLGKLDSSIEDIISCLHSRYMSIIESINSLKLMAKLLIS